MRRICGPHARYLSWWELGRLRVDTQCPGEDIPEPNVPTREMSDLDLNADSDPRRDTEPRTVDRQRERGSGAVGDPRILPVREDIGRAGRDGRDREHRRPRPDRLRERVRENEPADVRGREGDRFGDTRPDPRPAGDNPCDGEDDPAERPHPGEARNGVAAHETCRDGCRRRD